MPAARRCSELVTMRSPAIGGASHSSGTNPVTARIAPPTRQCVAKSRAVCQTGLRSWAMRKVTLIA